ncbi:peptidase C14, caspase domain-containing protein [Amylocystis lapponica]|nr:peptidase C14, caspase domain-containing protein [Amylocystis lapponica]
MPGTIRQPARKALSVGIRYEFLKPFDRELPGTQNDPHAIRDLLMNVYGYKDADIQLMIDDDSRKYTWPTRENILQAMRDLVAGAMSGDHFVFHFSGHGAQVPTSNPAEEDGLDEVIWPVDVILNPDTDQFSNYIVDDDIHDILVEHLPVGAHFVMIFDCCHSGSAADLPNCNGDECPPTPATTALTTTVKSVRMRSGQEPMQHTHTIEHDVDASVVETPNVIPASTKKIAEVGAYPDVTSWSACQDSQVTYELGGRGLFVKAFVKALRTNPTQTHAQLLRSVTRELANITAQVKERAPPQYTQDLCAPKPQLSGIERMDQIFPTPMEM